MFCKDESPLSPVSALRENQTSAGFLATQQNQKYVGTAGRETGDEQSRASLHFLLYVASWEPGKICFWQQEAAHTSLSNTQFLFLTSSDPS